MNRNWDVFEVVLHLKVLGNKYAPGSNNMFWGLGGESYGRHIDPACRLLDLPFRPTFFF